MFFSDPGLWRGDSSYANLKWCIMKNIIVLFFCLLTACATVAPIKPTGQSPEKMSHWQASGSMSIHQANRTSAFSFAWQQDQGHYTLQLFAPLGLASLRIVGSEDHVELWQSASQKITAKTPEILMQRQLGYALPVSCLYYWIRGLPDPHWPMTKTLSQQNHLAQLQQQGWKINFLDFKIVSGFALPGKIMLEDKTMQVKIVVTAWDLQ